jgi:hypothetical protein
MSNKKVIERLDWPPCPKEEAIFARVYHLKIH